MNRPGWLQTIPLYAVFDLSQVSLRRLLSVGLLPLVLFAVAAPFFFAVDGLEDGFDARAVVACADCEGLADGLHGWTLEVVVVLPDDIDERLDRGEIDAAATVDLDGDRAVLPHAPPGEPYGHPGLDADLRRWVEKRWLAGRAGPEVLEVVRPDGGPVEAAAGPPHPEGPEDVQKLVTERMESRFQVRDLGKGVGYAAIGLMGLLIGLPLGAGLTEKGREGFLALVGLQASRSAIYVGEMLSDGAQIAVQSAVWWGLYAGVGLLSVAAGWMAGEVGPALAVDAAVAMLLASVTLVQSCAVGCVYGQLVREVPVQVREHGRTVILLGIFAGAQAIVPVVENVSFEAGRLTVLGAIPAVGNLALWKLHIDGSWQLWPMLGLQAVWTVLSVWVGSFFFHLQDSPREWLRRRLSAR